MRWLLEMLWRLGRRYIGRHSWRQRRPGRAVLGMSEAEELAFVSSPLHRCAGSLPSKPKNSLRQLFRTPNDELSMTEKSDFLNDDELESMPHRCELATLGPWQSFIEGRDHTSGSSFIMTGAGTGRGNDIELSGATVADQDFIAHARQDIPRLLAEISRLRALKNRSG